MKKLILLAIVGIFLFSIFAVDIQPVNAEIRIECEDPNSGPAECKIDMDAEDYCLYYLPDSAPAGSNPQTVWEESSGTCYYYHDNISCSPYWNMLSDFYKLYTSTGIFEDADGKYVWTNGQAGCAQLAPDGGFRTPAVIKVTDGNPGSVEIRTGEFGYDYATCSGKCRISTTKMTRAATNALGLMPYKIYKKAYVSIVNHAGELALGQFKLCYNLEYNKDKTPAYYKYNGYDWTYYGGFWNASLSKYCMYSTTYGNYILVEQGVVRRGD